MRNLAKRKAIASTESLCETVFAAVLLILTLVGVFTVDEAEFNFSVKVPNVKDFFPRTYADKR